MICCWTVAELGDEEARPCIAHACADLPVCFPHVRQYAQRDPASFLRLRAERIIRVHSSYCPTSTKPITITFVVSRLPGPPVVLRQRQGLSGPVAVMQPGMLPIHIWMDDDAAGVLGDEFEAQGKAAYLMVQCARQRAAENRKKHLSKMVKRIQEGRASA